MGISDEGLEIGEPSEKDLADRARHLEAGHIAKAPEEAGTRRGGEGCEELCHLEREIGSAQGLPGQPLGNAPRNDFHESTSAPHEAMADEDPDSRAGLVDVDAQGTTEGNQLAAHAPLDPDFGQQGEHVEDSAEGHVVVTDRGQVQPFHQGVELLAHRSGSTS
jgi:hypothetical protein